MKKTSISGILFISEEEGKILHVYRDQVGKPTCGVGHLVREADNLKLGDLITARQSFDFLQNDLKTAEAAVNDSIKVPINQNQFDALVSLTFNIGDHAFSTSHLVIAINKADSKNNITIHWLAWDHAAGKVLADLVGRRKREINRYYS